VTADDRAAFDAAMLAFRTTHRDLDGQIGAWSDLALRSFAEYLVDMRDDISPEDRATGIPLVAELAIAECAAEWQRTCRKRRSVNARA
jgi:hypothetical protein